jgi:hypothetical protein
MVCGKPPKILSSAICQDSLCDRLERSEIEFVAMVKTVITTLTSAVADALCRAVYDERQTWRPNRSVG